MSYPTSRYNTLRLLIDGVERRILEHKGKYHLRHAMLTLTSWDEINDTLLAEKAKLKLELKELVDAHPEYFV